MRSARRRCARRGFSGFRLGFSFFPASFFPCTHALIIIPLRSPVIFSLQSRSSRLFLRERPVLSILVPRYAGTLSYQEVLGVLHGPWSVGPCRDETASRDGCRARRTAGQPAVSSQAAWEVRGGWGAAAAGGGPGAGRPCRARGEEGREARARETRTENLSGRTPPGSRSPGSRSAEERRGRGSWFQALSLYEATSKRPFP